VKRLRVQVRAGRRRGAIPPVNARAPRHLDDEIIMSELI
jgi:hypothetical protein